MMPTRARGWLSLRLPARWRTVRVRLTAFYGGLFLLAGAGLLVVTNVLVRHSTRDAVYSSGPATSLPTSVPTGQRIFQQRVPTDARHLQTELQKLHAHDVHQFLVQSVIALAVTAIVCVALGYFIAGRALRPVRTITAKVRTITAQNLHERVSVAGPPDELKQLGDTFDELLDRLDSAFQNQRQFIANASHELRSPLTRQRTITEVALGDPTANAETLRTAHERVLVAVMQQQLVIDALLTLARGQVGLQQPHVVDIATIAELVVDSRQDEAERRGLTLASALAQAQILGDERLLERLIANLVDNALQHNRAQGDVEIRTSAGDGHAHLDVINTGPVIAEEAIERIFQPFRRLDADRTHNDGRLGLGLSIVRAIADTHHATISTQPRPGGGLHIRITFTAARRDTSTDDATPVQPN